MVSRAREEPEMVVYKAPLPVPPTRVVPTTSPPANVIVKVVQTSQVSPSDTALTSVREDASSNPVSSNALVKIECA